MLNIAGARCGESSPGRGAGKPGMSRDDLLGINLKVMKAVGEGIAANCPDAFVICITNPLDAMVWALRRIFGPARQQGRRMAGVLDSARFATFLAWEFGVSVKDVNAFVLGGHGDTMVPVLSYSTINGIPVADMAKIKGISEDRLGEIVHAPARAAARLSRCSRPDRPSMRPPPAPFRWPKPTSTTRSASYLARCRLTASTASTGCDVGVPVVIGAGGAEDVIEISLTDEGKRRTSASAWMRSRNCSKRARRWMPALRKASSLLSLAATWFVSFRGAARTEPWSQMMQPSEVSTDVIGFCAAFRQPHAFCDSAIPKRVECFCRGIGWKQISCTQRCAKLRADNGNADGRVGFEHRKRRFYAQLTNLAEVGASDKYLHFDRRSDGWEVTVHI